MSEPTLAADLVAFLRARLDEDEQVARATRPASSKPATWNVEPWYDGTAERADLWDTPLGPLTNHGGLEVATAEHAARHDPARVLREVAAKRQIIDEHRLDRRAKGIERCRVCTAVTDNGAARFRAPCPTLRLLALPYVDHPDYRTAWAP